MTSAVLSSCSQSSRMVVMNATLGVFGRWAKYYLRGTVAFNDELLTPFIYERCEKCGHGSHLKAREVSWSTRPNSGMAPKNWAAKICMWSFNMACDNSADRGRLIVSDEYVPLPPIFRQPEHLPRGSLSHMYRKKADG